jgi:hypothetical protein
MRPSVRPELDADSGMRISVAWKQIQPDTPAPPNRVAASHFVPLGWWGVVNTTTLCEISPTVGKPRTKNDFKSNKIKNNVGEAKINSAQK